MDLILASTSPYRRAQVGRLGLPFRCVAPEVDEDEWKARWDGVSPRELAEGLAHAKAAGVAGRNPGAAVIGGDQLVALDGRVLGKPGTRDAAVDQLLAMSGRTHELITALAVIHDGRVRSHCDVARLTLRPLTVESIRRYVDADLPIDCAGSYKLESRGICLFDAIESDDHSAIVGIPLIALTTILRDLGLAIP